MYFNGNFPNRFCAVMFAETQIIVGGMHLFIPAFTHFTHILISEPGDKPHIL